MVAQRLRARLEAVENKTAGSGVVCILCEDGTRPERAISEWEDENGRLGDRTPVLVDSIDAQI